MKTTLTLITIITSLFFSACANNNRAEYWNARRAAIAALPSNQRAHAEIDLMRDQYADQQMRRQAMLNAANSISASADQISAMNMQRANALVAPGTIGNPIYIARAPTYNPPPVPVLTGY
jgi:hypothetical protein